MAGSRRSTAAGRNRTRSRRPDRRCPGRRRRTRPRGPGRAAWPSRRADSGWRPAVRVQPDQGQVGEVAPPGDRPASVDLRVSAGAGRPDRPCSSGTTSDDQRHDRGLRVAGQPGHELAPAVRHRRPPASGSRAGPRRCSPRTGAELGQRGVQVVDRAVHGAAGGADQVGVGRARSFSASTWARQGVLHRAARVEARRPVGAPSRRSQAGSCGPSESRTRPLRRAARR